MQTMRRVARQIWCDERGQDLIEYALLAGFMCVAAGALVPSIISEGISAIYSRVTVQLVRASGT
jgi:Flp pilus assembly pilin Flp